ncbi:MULTISPECIES: hypothetical protein [Streptomyces]|uniref:hypothetical protein n=1 Tax=Streptomyces TaxID=1883 RepID=UPI002F935A6A
MKISRRVLATGAATAICAVAAVSMANAQPNSTAPVTDTGPGYAVESFEYPDGARIGAERGIVLKRGDGHITLADCASSGNQIQVFSRTLGTLCFRAVGSSGQLTVEIPAVYGLRGNATHQTNVTLTAEGAPKQNVDVDKNQWQGVGEATDPQRRAHVLVDIRTSS